LDGKVLPILKDRRGGIGKAPPPSGEYFFVKFARNLAPNFILFYFFGQGFYGAALWLVGIIKALFCCGRRHVRIHTSQKPHQCEYYQLAFARSSHLERHRRTHTGERPFVCPIASCSKRFARQDKVKQHVIRHHTGLPRPLRQSSPKAYKARAAPAPLTSGGKRPRGRPRKVDILLNKYFTSVHTL